MATATRARTRAIVALVVCGIAIAAVIVLAFVLSDNVVYFRTVSEAVSRRDADGDHRFRMAGEVVAGSVEETSEGVRFRITDGNDTVTVVHKGDPPDLFKEGAPVVCEGHWATGEQFDSDRILIKHGNDYKPPDVDSDTTP
jgi:cytochrome c-type biogenesis protein CcmE